MHMTATILTFLTGGLGGSIMTIGVNAIKNRLQRMECHYIDDEILSKIPLTKDNTTQQNLHCKTFHIINTTNKDITEFKILFQFDASATITDCYSRSKEGYNKQSVCRSADDNNQAEALIKNFNRGDVIEYTFEVANVTDNSYYITECDCIGFKISVKDKRRSTGKSKSKRSDKILTSKH